jgi:hypothetical protein
MKLNFEYDCIFLFDHISLDSLFLHEHFDCFYFIQHLIIITGTKPAFIPRRFEPAHLSTPIYRPAGNDNTMTEIKAPKKLIEVALPLDDINNASVREKSIRHGHPSPPGYKPGTARPGRHRSDGPHTKTGLSVEPVPAFIVRVMPLRNLPERHNRPGERGF